MAKKNDIEKISLDIANYWTSNDFFTESNKNCGTLVAFDWKEGHLTEINTNIDLDELESKNFKFDDFANFLKKNNFTFVLGLRNVGYADNPYPVWTDKFKEILKSNEIDYDEYVVDSWPSPIPELDVPDNVFILRYSFDVSNKVDALAANIWKLEDFIETWGKSIPSWDENHIYLEHRGDGGKKRIIIFCSNIENLILHRSYDKMTFQGYV